MSDEVKRYTGQELHGFMFPDYDSRERRWVDGKDFDAMQARAEKAETRAKFLEYSNANLALEAQEAKASAQYDMVTCAHCGTSVPMTWAFPEEGDEWECPACALARLAFALVRTASRGNVRA